MAARRYFPAGQFGRDRSGIRRALGSAAGLALMLTAVAGVTVAADDCAPGETDSYVCEINSAEDLVQVPGSHWLVASAFAPSTVLNLIDTREKSWRVLYPVDAPRVAHNAERYPDCAAPPEAGEIVTHGLHIAPGDDGHATLHAVSHGTREAIEVFDIHIAPERGQPMATWIGCVPTPDAQAANSVVALRDGSLLATIPLETGFEFAEAMAGVDTGAVYRWTASENRWERLDATAQPYANGIEVSPDETTFFIASSGLRKVIAYSNSVPARRIAESALLPIAPDNLHRAADSRLITAGLEFEYAQCNPVNEAGEFDLALFGACPRPYQVIAADPDTLALTTLARGAASPDFSNITMGVVVEGNLWIGTFGGDRIAYRPVGTR
jgi:hypothetical protein